MNAYPKIHLIMFDKEAFALAEHVLDMFVVIPNI